ncbi:hypothetical protein IJI70_01720 [Candidatus Saccharibacteria bacterium]|nr:hypothetical protein [Candidatus Saccharibacteria bacterium]
MKNKNSGEELARRFAKKLIEDKRAIFKEGEKEAEIERIVEEVALLVNDRMIEELPDDRLAELYLSLDEEEKISQDKLNAIILGAKLDYEKITKEVLEKYREEYLRGEES